MDSTLPLRRKGATTVLKLGGSSAVGASRGKRRRRESRRRGGVGHGEGVSPSLLVEGSAEGAVPPPPEKFLIFYLKMVSFGAFWVALPRCMYILHKRVRQKRKEEKEPW